jgi:hypothetical protein
LEADYFHLEELIMVVMQIVGLYLVVVFLAGIFTKGPDMVNQIEDINLVIVPVEETERSS